MMMEDCEYSKKVLMVLIELGISVSIDDFGMGYSFFSYLKDFLIYRLKIDKLFIDDFQLYFKFVQIIGVIIVMGYQFFFLVVVEGVEMVM